MPDPSTTKPALDRDRFILATCSLLLISFSSLYLFLPPHLTSQPWDSLDYGYSIEVEGIRSIQGNHPLGHLIFFGVFSLAKQLGYAGRALTISQVTNGVLGGLIIAIFFAVLVSIIKVGPLPAVGFTLALGASYSFRFFAGTGDIYHFSIFFSLLAWASLVYHVTHGNHPFPALSGILSGLAILTHQLNIVLIPVGLALFLLAPPLEHPTRTVRIKQSALFLGVSLAVTLLGYLLLGSIATSSFSLTRVVGWMRGYFGDPTYGRYFNTGFLKTAWLTVSQNVMFSPRTTHQSLGKSILAIQGIMMFLGLWAKNVLDRRKQAILLASALACLLAWPLILWWEPQNPKFWLLTLLPWMISLALSFEAVGTWLRTKLARYGKVMSLTAKTLPMIIGIVFLSLNTGPVDQNKEVTAFDEAMKLWLDHSGPDDVIITVGDLIPHLRYWGKRPNTLYLYRSLQASQASADPFYDLRKKFAQALCKHQAVLITPAAGEYVPDSDLSLVGVTREELRTFLYETAGRGEILFWYRNVWDGKLLPVYALRQMVACADGRSALEEQITH